MARHPAAVSTVSSTQGWARRCPHATPHLPTPALSLHPCCLHERMPLLVAFLSITKRCCKHPQPEHPLSPPAPPMQDKLPKPYDGLQMPRHGLPERQAAVSIHLSSCPALSSPRWLLWQGSTSWLICTSVGLWPPMAPAASSCCSPASWVHGGEVEPCGKRGGIRFVTQPRQQTCLWDE